MKGFRDVDIETMRRTDVRCGIDTSRVNFQGFGRATGMKYQLYKIKMIFSSW